MFHHPSLGLYLIKADRQETDQMSRVWTVHLKSDLFSALLPGSVFSRSVWFINLLKNSEALLKQMCCSYIFTAGGAVVLSRPVHKSQLQLRINVWMEVETA